MSQTARHEHAQEARATVRPALVIVMGVSGSGKSTVGQQLSDGLRVPWRDGDDLHPRANVEKMSAGHPLNDEDRWPWLHRIRAEAAKLTAEESMAAFRLRTANRSTVSNALDRPTVVIACSALRKVYRELLRGRPVEGVSASVEGMKEEHSDVQTYFVYLKGSRDLLLKRMEARPGHFMKPAMLDSQLATLEEPTPDEDQYGGVIVVELTNDREQVRKRVEAKVRAAVGL